jgi:hypothetical protein
VEALGQLYAATPKQLAEFIYDRIPTESDERTVNACTQALRDDAKQELIHRKPYINRSYMYGLTDSGAKAAKERGVSVARPFENRDYEHNDLITEIILAYKAFARDHGLTFRFVREGLDHSRAINPDGVVYLGTEKGEYCICIEVERQKWNGESFLKKAQKYKDAFDSDDAKQQFGSRKFRVQFFVETALRRDFALKQFAEDYPNRMFWFATFPDINDIHKPVFLTPQDFKTRAYQLLDVIV